ncbi:MAG: PPC domain-containing protein [Planctomycetales bacterium]|nr:PPC domain-containing protein [Planctomycetales bacterium]
MNRSLVLVLSSVLMWCVSASLQAAPPQIARVSPLAVVPGKSIDLTLYGQQLTGPSSLWSTFAARTEFAAASDESSQKGEKLLCHVTVPRDEQVGVGALRVVTGEGVSNAILVMVDDLRSVAETADNHSVEQAQLLDLPLAVDGQSDSIQEDYYRFYAPAGQRYTFEVVAQRLGSKLDSVLRLLNAEGEEIARFDDAQGAGGDSRFSHTFETEGNYLLAISDVRHLGGAEYFYRLRIGQFPLITAVYPAGGRCGQVNSFQLVGNGVDQFSPLHVALPKVSDPRLLPYSVRSSQDDGSSWFQVQSSPGEQMLEQEPNNEVAEATVATFPGVINGRLEQPGDRDHFRFHATKGQRLHAVAMTRSLGSPCDLYLSLHKADGSQLAVAPQARDTVLDLLIPEDGDYVLRVEDLLSGGSSEYVYRIDLQEAFFGFALHAENMQYVAPQGGTVAVKVLATRSGFNGPIELAVEGLGLGVVLENNRMEAAETLMKITLPADLPQGAMRLARIIGKVKDGDQEFTVAATQQTPLLAMFPNTLSLPSALIETVAVGVGPPFAPFFELVVPENRAYFPQIVGTSTFDVEINRINAAFKEAVALTVNGLPEGITAEVAPVEDGAKAYRVTLKGPADVSLGTFPISIVGTATFQDQTKVAALENVTLQVCQPLVVSLKVPGPIVVGGSQAAEIHLQRFGAEPQPVRVQVSDGPPGLTAPILLTIPSDANQASLSLGTTSEVLPGKFDNLTVVASTSVQGQNITVHSEPVSGEIQAPPAEPPAEGEPSP